MTESIGTRLTALISPIVPLYLSEASTDTYPYAVYSQTLTYRRDKDEADFARAVPKLDGAGRGWLKACLLEADADHAWAKALD